MDTPRFRIGNDLTVLWAINNRDGSPYKLDDKEVRLFVTHPQGREEVTPILTMLPDGTTNNVIRWDFKGDDQRVLGLYTLSVEITTAEDHRDIKKDFCEAFSLVGLSCEECEQEGDENIQDGGDLILSSRLDIYRFGIPKITIGTNGNWFIDGVDSGRSALAGGKGLVNVIYNEEDFGGEFVPDSVIDTFNAHAINGLFNKLNALTLIESLNDVDVINPQLNQVLAFDGTEWRNMAFGDLLGKYIGGSGSSLLDDVVRRLRVLESWFKKYDDNTIYTDFNLISKKTLASGGKASSGTGGTGSGSGSGSTGGGFVVLEDWLKYDATLPQVLGAVLGVELHNRLTAIENGSVTPDLTPYATISFVEQTINNLIGGAGEAYDTLIEIQRILQDNEGDINTLLTEIATKASKEELASLDEKYAVLIEALTKKNSEQDTTLKDHETRIETLEDKEAMFRWVYNSDGTRRIETDYDLASLGTVASGGKGKQGSTSGAGGGIMAVKVNGQTISDDDDDRIIELPDYPEKVSDLENDEGYAKSSDVAATYVTKSEHTFLEKRVETNEKAIVTLMEKDTTIEEKITKIKEITDHFFIDEHGLGTHKNFRSTGTLSSGGAAQVGEGGGSGGVTGEYKMYVHTQGDPLKEWTITHNLNKVPNVKVIDSTGNQVYGDVKIENMNIVTVSFGGAFSGIAYLD